MKRLSVCFVALAFAGLAAVGCSKGADVATPSVPNVPNVGNIEADATKCAELATAWATLFVPAGTGEPDSAKIKSQIDDIKGKVPDSVKTDLDTIGTGIANASGPTGTAEFLSSPEFTKANTNVTNYLTKECATVGK